MTKQEMINEINILKKEKNIVILAHYYQVDEVQDIADFVGDSLALSRIASTTDADIIVFCGVHFMAETAKILSPNKKVLFPVMEAGCSMANMIDEIKLADYKSKNPNAIIISYVNSTAKVKALSDVCVTSSNAIKIIKHYSKENRPMLYCPDQNLGIYTMHKENLKFDVWNGFCCIHHNIKPIIVTEKKAQFPNALFIAHPECKLDVLQMADYVGSTKQLIDFVRSSDANEFIIGTEMGVIHEMKKQCPNKKFHILTESLKCYDMKLTKLEDVYNCIKNETNEIVLEEQIITKAKKALDNMLKLSE
ncbi:MAG: quinolinate synthase NadA [Anaeroplasmataceae bacterium]